MTPQKHDGKVSHVPRKGSIKRRVFRMLNTNPLLKPKTLCKILDLNYKDYKGYMTQLRHLWKYDPKRERGSKPSLHAWRGWTDLPRRELKELAQRSWVKATMVRCCQAGWTRSKSRNRFVYWKDKHGRLQLFETGRMNLYVRKPATLGRAYQLISNALTFTEVFTDLRDIQGILKGVRFHGAHYVFETGQKLPSITIDLFHESNGIILKVGDRSHPSSIEVIASYPGWGEKNERAVEKLTSVLEELLIPRRLESEKKSLDKLSYMS